MSISEETRHQLYQRLEGVLGAEDAATLMAHLPPVGWADVATKRDLDHFATVLEAKLDAGLADVRTELAQEVGGLRTELRTGLADVRTELHKEIGSLHQALGAQTRNLFLGLVGLQISGVTSAVVLSRVL